MEHTTVSETREYIEEFIVFALEHIDTPQELRRFTNATERTIDNADGRLREYLIEIEERVLTAF